MAVGATARSVLVTSAQRKERKRVVHISGVVSEITEDGAVFLTEDGAERKVAFGLNAAPPEPGTVVTLTGRVDAETGTLQVRSVHPLRKTIERLNGHVDELDQATTDRSDRLRRLKRVQELLERNSGRQVQLLTRIAEKLPEAAQAGLARAIEGLEDANRGVARAFERALKLAGEAERERRNVDDLPERRLPHEAKPAFEDLAAVLGMTEEELTALLKEGTTLEAIVERQGMTLRELHDGIVARVEERLKTLVEAGELTEEALELVLDQVRERIADRIRSLFHDSPIHDELPFSVEDLATVFGFGPEGAFAVETFARLREGATPFDLAEERGISRDELIEKLRAIAEERARSLVEEGALAEEDLDRSIERFTGRLAERLSEAKEHRAPRRDEDEERKKARQREDDARRIPFDVKVLAELFGTDAQSIRKLLVSGRTLEEIAAEHNATVEEAADRLLEEMKRKLRKQIESGHITDEEAAKLLDRARAGFIERLRAFRLEEREEREKREKREVASAARRIDRPYAGVPLTVAEIADVVGVPVDDLRELMAERGGIGKLLEDRGVTAEDVVAKLLALVEQRLRERTDAGEPAGEGARKLLSNLERRLSEDLGGRAHKVEPTRRSVETAATKAVLGFIPFDLQTIARALGIAPQRLRELLRERTVAELAERANVPLRAILDALAEPLEKRAQAAAADGTPTERLREKIAAAREDFLRALRQFKLPEGEVRRELQERDARRRDRPTDQDRPRLTDEAPPRLTPRAPEPISPPTATPAPAASAIRVRIAADVASACGLKAREWDVSVEDEWRTLRRALIACQNDLVASLKAGLADVNKRAAAIRADAADSTVSDGDSAGLAPADAAPADTASDVPAEDEVPDELLDALAGSLSSHGTIVDAPVATDGEARAGRLAERFETLSARISALEKRLSAISDDTQLANVDLQNALQQQQRALQTLSSVLKATHDIAMNAIRNTRA